MLDDDFEQTDVEPLHVGRTQKLVSCEHPKDISGVDEGETMLPGLLPRMKEPCLEAVAYFPRLRQQLLSADISIHAKC